jgi:hypothetical protein
MRENYQFYLQRVDREDRQAEQQDAMEPAGHLLRSLADSFATLKLSLNVSV